MPLVSCVLREEEEEEEEEGKGKGKGRGHGFEVGPITGIIRTSRLVELCVEDYSSPLEWRDRRSSRLSFKYS